MKNLEVRQLAEKHGVRLWQIAYELGITDSSFSRKLRIELSQAEKERIIEIIEKIKQEDGR